MMLPMAAALVSCRLLLRCRSGGTLAQKTTLAWVFCPHSGCARDEPHLNLARWDRHCIVQASKVQMKHVVMIGDHIDELVIDQDILPLIHAPAL